MCVSGKNVNKCGVTMKEIVKAVSVSTTVSKTEYLREFDELKGSIKPLSHILMEAPEHLMRMTMIQAIRSRKTAG